MFSFEFFFCLVRIKDPLKSFFCCWFYVPRNTHLDLSGLLSNKHSPHPSWPERQLLNPCMCEEGWRNCVVHNIHTWVWYMCDTGVIHVWYICVYTYVCVWDLFFMALCCCKTPWKSTVVPSTTGPCETRGLQLHEYQYQQINYILSSLSLWHIYNKSKKCFV